MPLNARLKPALIAFGVLLAMSIQPQAPAQAQASTPLSVFLAHVRPVDEASRSGLKTWTDVFARDIDIAVRNASTTSFATTRFELIRSEVSQPPTLPELRVMQHGTRSIYVANSLGAAGVNGATRVSSMVYLGDLKGDLQEPYIQIDQSVRTADYTAQKDALTVLTLYALANEAHRLGRTPASCRLLQRASTVARGIDLQRMRLNAVSEALAKSGRRRC